MKPSCIESTLDINTEGLTVRLWINQQGIGDFYSSDRLLGEKITYYVTHNKDIAIDSSKTFTQRLIEYCRLQEPNLNAIQVRNGDFGVVVYLVPFEDVHG